jgi:hypothetical protein
MQRRKVGEAAVVSSVLFQCLKLWRNGDKNADTASMGFINNLSSNYLQSVLNNAVQSSGLTANTNGITSPTALQPDNQQLSPFGQLLSTLQQLQQSDPSKYQQVTQQIATNLQSAAQTAQADGNSVAATQLNQLATDFSNASQSGQLPNIQDLAQASQSGHAHHHHGHGHGHSASADPDSTSSTSSSQTLDQLFSTLQANGAPNDPLNPMAIIFNTLSSAGIVDSKA